MSSPKKYRVIIKAVIIQELTVSANSRGEAEDLAHETFNPCDMSKNSYYEQETEEMEYIKGAS